MEAGRKRRAWGGVPRRAVLIAALALVFAFALGMLLRTALGRDELKGSWTPDGTAVYIFDGKGQGSLSLPLSAHDFRYTVRKDFLRIDFLEESMTDTGYSWTRAGDTLWLDTNTGTVLRLERQG